MKFAVIGEWFQEEAEVIRTFLIHFYPVDNEIEIFDIKSKRTFLRRTRIEDVQPKRDFFIGSKLSVFGRQIEIVTYADEYTKNLLGKSRESLFVLLKSSVIEKVGLIFDGFIKSDFTIINISMLQFNDQGAKELFGPISHGNIEITVLINQMSLNPSIGLELVGENILEKLMICSQIGSDQKHENPNNIIISPFLQNIFEDEQIRNGIYFPKTLGDSECLSKRYFDVRNNLFNTSMLKNTTLVLIKPHIIKEGKTGEIIADIIKNGFRITAIRTVILERCNCEEFYEIYRGVLHEYIQMVKELSSGTCVAMEIMSNENPQESHKLFRKLCGPMDPEIAKILRPNTLRAKYGKNKILNALHCTDLPEDSILEIEYFFKILE